MNLNKKWMRIDKITQIKWRKIKNFKNIMELRIIKIEI
jgi:hypothetical protein